MSHNYEKIEIGIKYLSLSALIRSTHCIATICDMAIEPFLCSDNPDGGYRKTNASAGTEFIIRVALNGLVNSIEQSFDLTDFYLPRIPQHLRGELEGILHKINAFREENTKHIKALPLIMEVLAEKEQAENER